jgi:hypothetical protein
MKWREAKKSGDNMNGQGIRERVGPMVLRLCFVCTALLWVACTSSNPIVLDVPADEKSADVVAQDRVAAGDAGLDTRMHDIRELEDVVEVHHADADATALVDADTSAPGDADTPGLPDTDTPETADADTVSPVDAHDAHDNIEIVEVEIIDICTPDCAEAIRPQLSKFPPALPSRRPWIPTKSPARGTPFPSTASGPVPPLRWATATWSPSSPRSKVVPASSSPTSRFGCAGGAVCPNPSSCATPSRAPRQRPQASHANLLEEAMHRYQSIHHALAGLLQFEEQRLAVPVEVFRKPLYNFPPPSFRPVIEVRIHTGTVPETFPILLADELLDVTAPAHVTPGGTELDQESVATLIMELDQSGKDSGALRLWYHSHGNLDVFWSGTDEKCINNLANGDYVLSLVTNKKGHMLARLDIFKPVRVTLDKVPVSVRSAGESLREKCREEIQQKVENVPVPFALDRFPRRQPDLPSWGDVPDEIDELEEQFMAGELTWQEYEDRLREVGNG